MNDDSEKKPNLLLGLVSNTQPATIRPKLAPSFVNTGNVDPPIESQSQNQSPVSAIKLREMMVHGESMDPIAGRRYREKEKVNTGILIRADYHQKLKILAVLERRRFNSYIEEAVEDYMQKIRDRLPEIS